MFSSKFFVSSVLEPPENSVSLHPCPPVHFVYQCRSLTMVHTVGQGSLPKTTIPEEFIDLRVVVQGDIHGKVEKTRLVNLDFIDASLFPHMATHAFMDCTTFPDGEFQWKWKPDYTPLWDSTLMCLHDLPIFGTTREVRWCMKFLINRVHNNTLWLDQAYPIHVEDIHMLTGFSMEGQDVTDGFQGSGKHGKKKGELSLYEKYDTHHGGRRVHIVSIKR
jgi:hypothetical protein